MPKRKKSAFMIRFEYVLVRAFVCLVSLMPYRTAFWLARRIGSLIYRIDRRHRLRALENLRAAFPDMTDEERLRIVKGVYQNLVESGVEMLAVARRIHAENVWEHVTVEGMEKLREVQQPGRGIIFVTGHMGSWESLGQLSGLGGLPLWSLARPLDNPLLDRMVNDMRERTGQRILSNRGTMRHALRVLREGGNLAFLIDQNARRGGIFVPFFGRPASTHTSVARIALKTGCPVFLSYAVREGRDLHFRIRIVGPLWPETEPEDEEAEIHRLTATVTAWLEEAVRARPDRWLWLHRRWRTQPEAAADQGESRSNPARNR